MKFARIALATALLAVPAFGSAATVTQNVKTSTVFIVNYNNDKEFLGWGSGFFVDEGIVVTNKHVIAAGDWYIVYATDADGNVDTGCRKNITKSDVKVNLDDDVAYVRVFLDCEHGVIPFEKDPAEGDKLFIVGYPFRGSTAASMNLLVTSGSVMSTTIPGWLRTDARLDFGNSGGPVVNGSAVLGVAVAKGIDEHGDFVAGYFIPSSVILRGLIYANDSRFGYSGAAPSWLTSSSSSVSSSRSSSSSSASSTSSVIRSSSSRSSVASSSKSPLSPRSFEGRTCARVAAWFGKSASMKARVNARLMDRFGFACP